MFIGAVNIKLICTCFNGKNMFQIKFGSILLILKVR